MWIQSIVHGVINEEGTGDIEGSAKPRPADRAHSCYRERTCGANPSCSCTIRLVCTRAPSLCSVW